MKTPWYFKYLYWAIIKMLLFQEVVFYKIEIFHWFNSNFIPPGCFSISPWFEQFPGATHLTNERLNRLLLYSIGFPAEKKHVQSRSKHTKSNVMLILWRDFWPWGISTERHFSPALKTFNKNHSYSLHTHYHETFW